MKPETDEYHIDSIEDLLALYGEPIPRSLTKELDYISEHYQKFVEKASFVVVATVGPEGLDCSPRGDPAGFVRVVDIQLMERRQISRSRTALLVLGITLGFVAIAVQSLEFDYGLGGLCGR